tara:strand:+ start:7304 stop:7519 length:216 start_codon:yes stop_codon:yes gene_type:complete
MSPSNLAHLMAMQIKRNQLKKFDERFKKNPKATCKKCDVELKVGDRVIAKSRTKNSKRYHYECAKILNIVD